MRSPGSRRAATRRTCLRSEGYFARGNHQRRQRRSRGGRQTPRNHQRGAAEKFRGRPRLPRGRRPSPSRAANSPDDDINLLRAVTADDVNRVAKKYLDFDHAISAVLTPTPSDKPISGKSFGGGESLVSTKNENVKLPPWAHKNHRGFAGARHDAQSLRHKPPERHQTYRAAGNRQRTP